jgi:prepilin-type N-terminal cleavage/methylation domain-containing protein
MKQQHAHYWGSRQGFSLIELLIVIAIIIIGTSMAALNFNQWQNKSAAEAQIRQMLADISELRIRAITTKQPASVTLFENSYVLMAYTSSNGLYNSYAQQTVLPGGTRTVKFPLTKLSGAVYNGEFFEINERGLGVSNLYTVYLGGGGTNGAIDCLKIHTLRTNVGKSGGGACNDK